MVWPWKKVDYHGIYTNDVLPFDLPKDRKEWHGFFQHLRDKYKANAVLFVEQRDAEIVAIFESPHGTHSWHIEISAHGDVHILEAPKEKTDVDSVGLLWRPNKKSN